MNIKPLVEGSELKGYRILNSRKSLSLEKTDKLNRLEKGFAGELLFYENIVGLSKEWLLLNDLQLESNNNKFQIDSLLICKKSLMLFEVKNYEGDYYIEGDKWYYMNGDAIQNPVNQLERTESLVRRLLQDHKYNNIPIQSYVVFVNSNFHLYNAPRNLPIIFPTQLNRFFKELNNISSKTNNYQMRLAKKLHSLHKNITPELPKYSYGELRKGVICGNCCSFNLESKKNTLFCKDCGTIEDISLAILRSVDEYTLFFPEQKITISYILDWCNGIRGRDTIRKILLKKYTLKWNGKASYYEKSSD
ncbi:nuclease-related domain-containing protein [Lederbergia panacisoli]|uniref:nuclease-related domain-containing protein n=1 Tax=Lederbergia panacisoli TaxID=1255251 RepID=UPI00214BE55A|nr:nuclease-related domain-containing protein [Lederbergia panacisoli]MCR2822396.1 NERD domain-containing protein [Lederbergia panacisoli]